MIDPSEASDNLKDDLGQIHGPGYPPPREPDVKTLFEQLDYEHKAHVEVLQAYLKELRTERNRHLKACNLHRKELDALRPAHLVLKSQHQALLEKNQLSDWLIGAGTGCFGVYGVFPFTLGKVALFVAGLILSLCGYYFKFFATRRPSGS